jgi:hypothetical protein
VSILVRQQIFNEDDEKKIWLLGKLLRFRVAARLNHLKIKRLNDILAAAQQRRNLLQRVIFVMMSAVKEMTHVHGECRKKLTCLKHMSASGTKHYTSKFLNETRKDR